MLNLKYVEKFLKDENGDWRSGKHGYPALAIDAELLEWADYAYDDPRYVHVTSLLAEDEFLRDLLLTLHEKWYQRWVDNVH